MADHHADGLIAVPSMLQAVCSLEPDVLASIETASLRYLALSGSALPSRLAIEVLDRFGPVLYNVYGSTEVATATIAGPHALRRTPTTSGRPAPGVRVEILDQDRHRAPVDESGWVFVGNRARFEGYTNGGGKEVASGLVSTGDLGHFDRRRQLFLVGREDDMIVSGGENVYPSEVEEVLNRHEAVLEAVVVPTDDERFGSALKAFIVARPGQAVAPEALKEYLAEQLAIFKVPRVFEYVDELPRNATGKVLRRTLK
ncbi:AMP-binding protein [Nocardioides marmoriginsengisoli]|uniref:AMP-binding protein n=1 Tax=Nocardioides marmoriginsengisoli TaxID=661483 RepID=UPI001C838077|nr:AMP-binding protein [Nocardioides marmoriginsengisoli]